MVKCRECGEEAEFTNVRVEEVMYFGSIIVLRLRKWYYCPKCKVDFEVQDYRAVDCR